MARERESRDLRRAGVVAVEDEVVALGRRGVVAPDDLGDEERLLLGDAQLLAQRRADAFLEGRVVLAVLRAKAPLIAKERGQVEVLADLVDRHALGDATAEERRREERVVVVDVGAATRESLGRLAGVAADASKDLALGDLSTEGGVLFVAAAQLAQSVEDAQSLEGVLAVEEAAAVDLTQVAFDVGARERGPAEQDRDVAHAALVHQLQVLAHDQRALHQEAAHARGRRPGVLRGRSTSR